MVKRELYLQKLIDFQNQPLIKVMAGMRRSGKSTLLAMFKEHLLSHGISPEAIIQLNFELMLLDPVEDYRQLYQLIKRKMQTVFFIQSARKVLCISTGFPFITPNITFFSKKFPVKFRIQTVLLI